MFKVVSMSLLLFFAAQMSSSQTHSPQRVNEESASSQTQNVPSMPSEEEIGELLNKANEYVKTYRETFTTTKRSLDKAPTPGYYEKGMELSTQASDVISAIKKNGSTAYALVGLIGVLDDMSLNAARASAATMVVALGENKSNPKDNATQDFIDLAQAEKNCYDISELLLHATLRYIAVEETALRTLLNRQ